MRRRARDAMHRHSITRSGVTDSGPAPGGASRNDDLMQRRKRRAEHRTGIVAAAVLHVDHGGVDALARNVFQRHRPAAGAAVPVTDLQLVAHHVVIGDLAPAIFAATDRDRHRSGYRADPHLAASWTRGSTRCRDRYSDLF